MRQDADDISLPGRLARLHQFMLDNPDVAVAGTAVELVEEGEVWGNIFWPLEPTLDDWVKGSQLVHPSCVLRKKAIEAVGLYNPEAIRVEDLELWYRLLAGGYKLVNLDEVLYRFTWGQEDYLRKTFRSRLNGAYYRFQGYRRLNVPWRDYRYCLKPLLLACLPKKLLYRHHANKFRRSV